MCRLLALRARGTRPKPLTGNAQSGWFGHTESGAKSRSERAKESDWKHSEDSPALSLRRMTLLFIHVAGKFYIYRGI